MDPTQPTPEAISHRQLRHLLQKAVAEPAVARSAGDPGEQADGDPELEGLLQAYSRLSAELLRAFDAAGAGVGRGRTPRQVMALGALRAHTHMALQYLAASRS